MVGADTLLDSNLKLIFKNFKKNFKKKFEDVICSYYNFVTDSSKVCERNIQHLLQVEVCKLQLGV